MYYVSRNRINLMFQARDKDDNSPYRAQAAAPNLYTGPVHYKI